MSADDPLRSADDLPRSADAIVVGGGVMGASTAFHLAGRGVRDVVLLEREPQLCAMSTGACAGGIRHQFATETNIRFSIESIRMLERFQEEPGQDVGLRLCGYLFLLTEPADVEQFQANVALQHRLGIETRWLGPEELAGLLPLLNLDGVLGGTFCERDGLADPHGVTQGYAVGARRLGARILTETPVTGIRRDGERITGVETPRGTIDTSVVVNACGAWAPELGRMVGVDIPIEAIRRQMAVTAPIPSLPPDFPFVVFFKDSLYFHREGQGILTGKSNPAETPGFKLTVDPEWEQVHLAEAVERMPLLADAGLLSRWAGLYEVTPDAHPILGRIPTVEGFYVMAGFSGHGFMHGPIAGKLMAEEIVDGRAHTVDIDPFRYDRFLVGELHPEYNVI
ncbi:MAG TPA: FAD-binding oxidoreductase [Actinomycetota bacterium]|nr:FAD-binding oxidoreductase [Actinomycetota bacterium]